MNASSFANNFTQVSYFPVMEHNHHQQYPQQQQSSVYCGYPSKHCENQRTVKRNGELHRFCEHHRLVANRNQQRLQQRRRMQKTMPSTQQPEDLAAMHQLYNEYTVQQQHLQMQIQGEGHAQTVTDSIPDLFEEDLRVLEALLLDDDDLDFSL